MQDQDQKLSEFESENRKWNSNLRNTWPKQHI